MNQRATAVIMGRQAHWFILAASEGHQVELVKPDRGIFILIEELRIINQFKLIMLEFIFVIPTRLG